jgi:hypothetical protein
MNRFHLPAGDTTPRTASGDGCGENKHTARVGNPAAHFGAAAFDPVVEHRQDQTAFVPQDMGHFRIDALALGCIQFALGGHQQFVELGVLELGVVPFGGRQVCGRIHLVLHRTATPIRGAERGNVPDVGPIAVIGLQLNGQRDACRIGRSREQVGRVNRPWERTRSNLQHDGRPVMAGLLVSLGSGSSIIFTLSDGFIKQRIGGVDRKVVAARTKAAKDLVDHFLTVDRQFQGHPQIVVVKRRLVAMHDEHIMPRARSTFDRHTGITGKQRHDLGVNPVDQVNLTRLDRRGAGGVVVDRQNLDRIGMALGRIPVVGMAFKGGDDAGFVRNDLVGTRAVASRRIVNAATGLDHKVIVGHQEGQVGVGRGQLQRDHVAFGGHFRNALHDAHGAGLCLFIGVTLQRGNHVFGGHSAAAVVFHPGADLEFPFGRIGVRRHLFSDPRFDLAVVHVDQHFAPCLVDHEGHIRRGQCRVQRVGAFTASNASAQNAALLGLFGMGGFGEQGTCQSGRHAHGRGAAHEFAAGHRALANACNHKVQLVRHSFLPVFCLARRP